MTKDEHAQAVHGLCIAPAEFRYRKITEAADNRMRTRTAKGQRANALDALKAPDDVPLPDADNESTTRSGVLL